MTIDGTNISAFGLKVLNLDDYFNLPARKKILTIPGTDAKDIVFQPKTATIQLLGRFTNAADLLNKLNAFETLLKTKLNHAIELVGHNETFNGVFDKGFEVISYNGGKIAKVMLSVTITE
jgi:hypothetical protein